MGGTKSSRLPQCGLTELIAASHSGSPSGRPQVANSSPTGNSRFAARPTLNRSCNVISPSPACDYLCRRPTTKSSRRSPSSCGADLYHQSDRVASAASSDKQSSTASSNRYHPDNNHILHVTDHHCHSSSGMDSDQSSSDIRPTSS